MKHKNHWLRSAKLPTTAIQNKPVITWKGEVATDRREVIVSAVDTHGAIVRLKGRMRYFAPFEELPAPQQSTPSA